MSPVLHSRREIASFFGGGDPRLITAAYREPARAGELYILEDGNAASIREWTRTHLRCPFLDCPQPQLKAVARARRRDGFSHLPGAHRHSPESVHHLQGKAVVAEWLRAKFGPDAVEVEAASDTQRTRIADVMLTLPEGQRVAFEIQYAPLTVQQWIERHESYRDQGIVDVWLWGHTRLTKAVSREDSTLFIMSDVQDEVMSRGLPVLFLHPDRRRLGVAVNDWQQSQTFAYDSRAHLSIHKLSETIVDATGVTSSWFDHWRTTGTQRLEELRVQAAAHRVHLRKLAGLLGRVLTARRDAQKIQLREAHVGHRHETAVRTRQAERWRARGPAQPRPAPTVIPTEGPWSHCRRCGDVLGEPLQSSGFHVLCRPYR